MTTTIPPRPTAARRPLLTLAQLDTSRRRHLANGVECFRRADQHPTGTPDHDLWATRGMHHAHFAFRLRSVLDDRTSHGSTRVFPARMAAIA